MKNNKKITKTLLLSSLAVLAFGSVAAGSTYALFTSKDETNVTISTGKITIEKTVKDVALYSLSETSGDVEKLSSTESFINGGTFAYDTDTGEIKLDRFTPGDKVEFTVSFENKSDINIKYRTVLKTLKDTGLLDGLEIKVDGVLYSGETSHSNYEFLAKNTDFTKKDYVVSISLPQDRGEEYAGKSYSFMFNLEAVQGNAKVEDAVDTTYSIYTPTDLAIFAKKVNNGTLTETKAVLENTIDMSGVNYTSPIYDTNTVYKHDLEFDGQGYSIENFAPKENGGVTGLIGGIFAGGGSLYVHNITFVEPVVKGSDNTSDGNKASAVVLGSSDSANVTISDITISNANVSNTKWGGIVTGYTSGDTTIENIKVSDSTVENTYTAGCIIGQVGGNTTNINSIEGSNNNVTGIKREGGIIGAVSGSTVNINYDGTKFTSTISDTATNDKGSIAGLSGNKTFVNDYHYYSVNSQSDLNGISNLSSDKTNVIELGKGTYDGHNAPLANCEGGVKVVGRGDKENIKWIQATGDGLSDAANSGYSFSGTAVEMYSLTLTQATSGYLNGFPGASSTYFEDCLILVDHEHGSMGYWGDSTATFKDCKFDSTGATESNLFLYGGKVFTFDNCEFISDESALKIYKAPHSASTEYTINVNNCTFKNNHATSLTTDSPHKSAIQVAIDNAGDGVKYNISVTGYTESTVSGNYAKGVVTGYDGLLGVKNSTSVSNDNVNLTVNGAAVTLNI